MEIGYWFIDFKQVDPHMTGREDEMFLLKSETSGKWWARNQHRKKEGWAETHKKQVIQEQAEGQK